MTLLTGFERSQGNFTNKDTGEVIDYSNRILYCMTDDSENETFCGFVPFQEKVKTSDLAKWLGCKYPADVDNILSQHINRPIDFKRGPNRKGEFLVNGLKLVDEQAKV